ESGGGGRAGLGPRRVGPGSDPEPHARSPERAGVDIPVRGARPVGRQARERPGRGYVRGPDRRGGGHRALVHRAAPSLHRGAPVRGAQARPEAPDPAHRARGGRGGPGQPAAGLLLPPEVPVRRHGVPGGDAASRDHRPPAPGRLSPRSRAHTPGRRGLVRSSRKRPGARRPPGALETGRHVFIRTPVARDASALALLARGSLLLHRPWVYPPTTAPAVARWLRTTGPN